MEAPLPFSQIGHQNHEGTEQANLKLVPPSKPSVPNPTSSRHARTKNSNGRYTKLSSTDRRTRHHGGSGTPRLLKGTGVFKGPLGQSATTRSLSAATVVAAALQRTGPMSEPSKSRNLTSTSSASPSRSRSSISSAPTLAPSFSAIFSRPLPPRTGTPPGHNRSPADPGRSQRELPRPARAGRRGGARVLGLGFGVGTRGEGRGRGAEEAGRRATQG